MRRGDRSEVTSKTLCRAMRIALPLLLVHGACLATDNTSAPSPMVEAEISDVATLKPNVSHRVALGGLPAGFTLVNGDTGLVEATVQSAANSNLVIDPANRFFYVAETMWTRGNRGKREDVLSIYDSSALKLVAEIDLPGRILATSYMSMFDVGVGGKRAYVYNMEPAASVITVDLEKRRVASITETPGCALVFPWGDAGFSSLCADGSLASTSLDAKGKGSITHTKPFFDADRDPVFESSLVDRDSSTAYFISYTGMIYPAKLGPVSQVNDGWSLQRAAGLSAATTAPDHVTWRPGGFRILAWHKASGRLYVLMHEGKPWSQRAPGQQVWVVDPVQRKVLARLDLPQAAVSLAVSQDAEPQLYAISKSGTVWVLDSNSGKVLHSLADLAPFAFTAAVAGF